MIKVLVAASAVVFRKTVAEVQRDANRERVRERYRKQKQKAREKKTTEKQFQTENERF